MVVFGVFEGVTFVLAAGDELPTFSRLADPLLEDQSDPLGGLVRLVGRLLGVGAAMMRALAIGGFLTALVLFAVVEWMARREGSRIPTLGEVCAYVMRYEVGPVPVGRIGLFGFWWWLGWHFLAR